MGLDTTIRVVIDVLLFLDARRTASQERREDPAYLAEDVSALPLSGLLSRNASQATAPATNANLSRAGSYQDDLDLHLASLEPVSLNDTAEESEWAASESRSRSGSHVKNLVEQQRRDSNLKEKGKEKKGEDEQSISKTQSRIKRLSFLGLGKRRANKEGKDSKDKKHKSLVKSAADQEEEDLLDFAKTFFTWAETRLEEQGADEELRRDVHVAGRSLVEDDWDALRKVFEPALSDSQELEIDERKQSTTTESTSFTAHSSFDSSIGSQQGSSNANRRHRRPRTMSKSAHLVPIPPLKNSPSESGSESEQKDATTRSTVSNLQKLILRIEDTLVDDLVGGTANVTKRVDRSAIFVQKKIHKAVLRRRSRDRRKRAATEAADSDAADNDAAAADDEGAEDSDYNNDSDADGAVAGAAAGAAGAVAGAVGAAAGAAAAAASAAVGADVVDSKEEAATGGVFEGIVKSLSYIQRLSIGRMKSLSVTEETKTTASEPVIEPVPLPESMDSVNEQTNNVLDLLVKEEPLERSGSILRSALSDVEENVRRTESSEAGSISGKIKRRHLLPRHRPHLFHRHRRENRKVSDKEGSKAKPSRRRRRRNSDPDIDKATMHASKVGTRQQERLEALRQILSQQRRSTNGPVVPHHMKFETDELLARAPELLLPGESKSSMSMKRFSPRFLRKQATDRDALMSLECDNPAANTKNSAGLYDSEASDVDGSGSDCESGDGCGPDEVAGLLQSFEKEGQQHKDTSAMDKWKGYMDLLRSASWFPTSAEKSLFFKNAAVAGPDEAENVDGMADEEKSAEVV